MKSSSLRVTAAATLVALSLTGCTNSGSLSPGAWAAIGVGAVALIATGVVVAKIIARNRATVEQRRIAEERAKLFYAEMDAKKKEELRKKDRLIAVDTKKETPREDQKEVMLWNPATEEIVGNTVYVVKPAKVGQQVSYDGYKAEYIGSGPVY